MMYKQLEDELQAALMQASDGNGKERFPLPKEGFMTKTTEEFRVAAVKEALDTWISEKYPTPESAKLKCAEATIAMVQSFPTLVRIRGYAMVGVNMRPHWWCQTEDGQIVDPTAHQWDSPPVFYEPFQGTEPHGKCLHCGELLFRSQGAQSFTCADCSPKRTDKEDER